MLLRLRQLTTSDATLAACWIAHQLQVGRADVQDSADVISTVSEPAHLVAYQRTQHSIVVRPTAVRAISIDIICQTIVQHCRTSDLELTALSTFKSRPKLICFLLLSANYTTYLFRQCLCSRLTSLWHYINFVLLLLLLLFYHQNSDSWTCHKASRCRCFYRGSRTTAQCVSLLNRTGLKYHLFPVKFNRDSLCAVVTVQVPK